MLTFNLLLEAAGIPAKQTQLVRHKGKGTRRRTAYDLWKAEDGTFERYQCIQSKPRFREGGWIASFVRSPFGETIFVGLYRIKSVGAMDRPDALDPLGEHPVADCLLYDLEKVDVLRDLEGKLLVDWGLGALSWVQNAHAQDKPIVELRPRKSELPFPGFAAFNWLIRSLATVPREWHNTLASSNGVYLLVELEHGHQYVGSTYNNEGFWGRWMDYATNGHGGNEGLKLGANKEYQVSVLEVASSGATREDIVALEQKWKDRLLTRRFGLNRN
jgi:hypothetical protein